jgi:hypothetical protein
MDSSSYFHVVSAGFIDDDTFNWWLIRWLLLVLFTCFGVGAAAFRQGYLISSIEGLILHLAFVSGKWRVRSKVTVVEAMQDFLKLWFSEFVYHILLIRTSYKANSGLRDWEEDIL